MEIEDLKPASVLHFSQYDQMIQAAINGQGVALGRLPLLKWPDRPAQAGGAIQEGHGLAARLLPVPVRRVAQEARGQRVPGLAAGRMRARPRRELRALSPAGARSPNAGACDRLVSSADAPSTTARDGAARAARARRCKRACCSRIASLVFACSIGGDRRLEAQHVAAVGLAPAGRRHHRRAGGKRDDREALERPRRRAEEVDGDAVAAAARAGRTGTRSHRRGASRSSIASSEPRLGNTPKPARSKRRMTRRSNQSGLSARRTKWKRPRICGKLPMPATVATSQLPKCPVRSSTPLPC